MSRTKTNTCTTCGKQHYGNKNTACYACIKIVSEYYERVAQTSGEMSIVRLHDRLSFARGGESAVKVASMLTGIYKMFDKITSEYDKYEQVDSMGQCGGYDFYRHTTNRLVPKEVAQSIADLAYMINESLKESLAIGENNGVDILSQLASGKITSERFEESVILNRRSYKE